MRVLLLRGLLREARHWGEFPRILAKGLGLQESSVVCLDLPGIGSECERQFPLSIERAKDDVRERWLQMRDADGDSSDSDALLFSVSLGSMIAASWASNHPEDFSKGFVLTNTSVANFSGIQERISLEALSSFAKIMKAGSVLDREKCILQLVSNRCHSDRAFLEQKTTEWAGFAMDQKAMLRLGVRQLFAASRFQLTGSVEQGVPMLCLASLYDRLLSPAATMRVAEFFGADQEFHHSAGHDLPLDDPEWVIQKLHSWLDQRPC